MLTRETSSTRWIRSENEPDASTKAAESVPVLLL